MVLEYQNKFDMLLNINTELTSSRDSFTNMECHLLVIRRVNNNLLKQSRILERKCVANEQYSSQEYLEILGIPDRRRNCPKNFQ